MEVDLQVAYAEACKAVGEAHVRERLLVQRCAELEAHIAAMTPQEPAPWFCSVVHRDDDGKPIPCPGHPHDEKPDESTA